MIIEEYLATKLEQEWKKERLKTIVGEKHMQTIGNELDKMLDYDFNEEDMDKVALQAKRKMTDYQSREVKGTTVIEKEIQRDSEEAFVYEFIFEMREKFINSPIL